MKKRQLILKIIPEKKQKQKIEDLIRKRPIKSKEEMVAEAKAALRRSVSSYDGVRPSKRERRSSDSIDRKPAPVRRKIEKPKQQEYVEVKETKSSDEALRYMFHLHNSYLSLKLFSGRW